MNHIMSLWNNCASHKCCMTKYLTIQENQQEITLLEGAQSHDVNTEQIENVW